MTPEQLEALKELLAKGARMTADDVWQYTNLRDKLLPDLIEALAEGK